MPTFPCRLISTPLYSFQKKHIKGSLVQTIRYEQSELKGGKAFKNKNPMPKLLVIDDYDSHKWNKKVSNQEQHGAIQTTR
jgi:hypothetical protein